MLDLPILTCGTAQRAYPGEQVCGDMVACWTAADGVWACAVDGLGHGAQAHDAARAFMAIVTASATPQPLGRLVDADKGLRATRGAAAALARIDLVEERVEIAAIGNIRGMILGAADRWFEGVPGIVGAHMRSPRQLTFSFCRDDLLAMWTDGLVNVDLRRTVSRHGHDPRALADLIIDDFGGQGDDCGVLCVGFEAAGR